MQQEETQRKIAEKKAAAEERRELEMQRRQREVCFHITLCGCLFLARLYVSLG